MQSSALLQNPLWLYKNKHSFLPDFQEEIFCLASIYGPFYRKMALRVKFIALNMRNKKFLTKVGLLQF